MSDEQHNDEETERLLAEMEEREQLEKEATELGVEFRSNISTEKLKDRVKAAAEEQSEAETDAGIADHEGDDESETDAEEQSVEINIVTNVSKNPRQIGGKVIAIGDSYTLTETDKQNDRLIAKVTRSVELGLLRVEG